MGDLTASELMGHKSIRGWRILPVFCEYEPGYAGDLSRTRLRVFGSIKRGVYVFTDGKAVWGEVISWKAGEIYRRQATDRYTLTSTVLEFIDLWVGQRDRSGLGEKQTIMGGWKP